MATATPRRPSALIGAFPTLRGNAAVLDLWRDVVRGMTDSVDAAFVRAFQVSTLARPVPASFLDQAVTESLKVPARIWREALEDMLAHDQSASLGRITAPTLIVWGDQDGFASRQDQDRLAGAIAGARLRVHAGGGHAPHWQDPARTASDLLASLSAAGLRAHAGQQRVTNSF